jgi:hypothetical protein
MNAAVLTFGGVLVLAMIGVSAWAWRTLPPDVRIPVHGGIGGYNNFTSKTTGLITWPLVGVVIYGVFFGVIKGAISHHGSADVGLIISPIVLVVLLVGQVGAIRAAVRR